MELEDTQATNQKNISNKVINKIRYANIVFLVSTILQFLAGTILYAAVLIVFTVIKDIDFDKVFYYYISPFIEIIAIFLPVVFYFLISKSDYKYELRINKIKLKHIIPFIVVGISAQYVGGFLNSFVIVILQQFGRVPINQNIPVPANNYELMYSILVIAAIPAIFEELLSRGLIQRAYEGYGAKWSIILSAVLFGILHYDIQNFIFPIFFGLILAYVVYRTNSIFSGMLIHFVNNGLAAVLLYLYPDDMSQYYEPYTWPELVSYGIFASIAFVFLACSLFYIYKTTTTTQSDLSIETSVENENITINFTNYWPIFISLIILLLLFTVSILEVIQKY